MSWNFFIGDRAEVPIILQKIFAFQPSRIWIDNRNSLQPHQYAQFVSITESIDFNSPPWEKIHSNPLSLIYLDDQVPFGDPILRILESHPSILILEFQSEGELPPEQLTLLNSLISYPAALILLDSGQASFNQVRIPAGLENFAKVIQTQKLSVEDLANALSTAIHELHPCLSRSYLIRHWKNQSSDVATRFDSSVTTDKILAHGLASKPAFLGDSSAKEKNVKVNIAVGTLLYQLPENEFRWFLDSLDHAVRTLGEGVKCALHFGVHDGKPIYAKIISEGNFSFSSHILPNTDNPGFGTGMNRLMSAAFKAGAELFFGLNPDGMLHPDMLLKMIQFHRAHPRSLIEARQFPEEHPKVYDPVTFVTPWITGSCFLVTPEIFAATRGFDENIFMYCEDVDFSWRARIAGFETMICPEALFQHSPTNRGKKSETESFLAARYLAKKWGNTNFGNWCEAKLQTHCGISVDQLPVIAAPPPMDPIASRKVADFTHELFFAETRW